MLRRLVKALIPKQLFKAIEPYGHGFEAILANIRYGFPARGIKFIGVTGTDGKTTTSTLIYTMLNDAGIKTGLMTTIGYGTPDNWHDNYEHMTTVSSFKLMSRIKDLRSRGVEWIVLETTSHALAQNRVLGVPYSLAVLTNLAHEHLDYHGTFERYRDAKLKLFQKVGKRKGVGIVNADDPVGEMFARAVGKSISYGLASGDVRPSSVVTDPSGSSFKVAYRDHNLDVMVNLPGHFNVMNALAAICVGFELGQSDEQIAKGIASLRQVEGRMNTIDEGQDFTVVVDFAHTPQSFEKILSDFRSLAKRRLIVVFGSAGRRDEAKRAVQGQIAGKYADVVIVTEEDDRDIDGNQIMVQIAEGAGRSGKREGENLFMIHDRSEAIAKAINIAQTGDTVMLLGKGHEKTIERATGIDPWDEIAQARAAIQARLGK